MDLMSGRQEMLRELKEKTKLLEEEMKTKNKFEERHSAAQEVIGNSSLTVHSLTCTCTCTCSFHTVHYTSLYMYMHIRVADIQVHAHVCYMCMYSNPQ